eukprot:765852-Hanusia_phi.AAC.16
MSPCIMQGLGFGAFKVCTSHEHLSYQKYRFEARLSMAAISRGVTQENERITSPKAATAAGLLVIR